MPDWKPRDTKRARELRRAATPAERRLWRYLHNSRLGAKFSRQMPVAEHFYADFLCREHSLIIEIDGHSHDVDPGRDIWRDRCLAEAGFRVLHFSNAEVLGNVEGVIRSICLALGEQAHPRPLPHAGGE